MSQNQPDAGGFHRLRVLDTRAEIRQATTVLFDIPLPLQEVFRWRAGQHITLRLDIGGVEVRRSYSISDTPEEGGALRITVKRVENGQASNYINDRISSGDEVDVMPPFGGFCLDPDPQGRRTCYFFGAGSGITPLYAMIRSVLSAEPHSAAHLLYGNVNAQAIIFRDDLARLEDEAEGRLTVRHILSAPGLLSSFPYWRRGRINAVAITRFIEEHPPYAQDAQYYICGPGGMNAAVRAALTGLDVPDDRIHTESYGMLEPPDDSVAGVAVEGTVWLNGKELRVEAPAGQTVLNAVRAAGGTPPYSCESGVCGACRARLHSGSVHMRARMALSDAEVARGTILTCQALSTTPHITVEYR